MYTNTHSPSAAGGAIVGRLASVNYRLLYFFQGRTVSVVAHGLAKESAVPAIDIKQAITRKAAFTANPAAHTFKGETNDA